ncbi:hypothetical protein MGU_09411 [Metarhizium guizhouense ARSEF 977]|uniref:Uncharacterized protein n=1 Tax=Metarhizium guizhouense (strain ARSEF 977) TaxID=1276136 RepID=A0A0B4G9A1_METGA|nr:hypothetical protein MGU_09411 [Metarhizium guizhouense ARSEF 977]
MARKRQSKHTKKQKETARKRGPSYLRKGVELGQKANIIAGGFYEEPTHHGWCLSCHIPEGRDLPDLQAIFNDQVQVQQVPYDLRSGKRGTTIIISGASSARTKKGIDDSLSQLDISEEDTSSRSTPSLVSDDLDMAADRSLNEDDASNTSDWDLVDGYDDIIGTDGTNQCFSGDADRLSEQGKNDHLAQITPAPSISVTELINGRDGEELIIHEEDFVNWCGSETPTVSPNNDRSLSVQRDTTVSYKLTSSVRVANSPMGVGKNHDKLRVLAAAAAVAAARRRVANLILEDW